MIKGFVLSLFCKIFATKYKLFVYDTGFVLDPLHLTLRMQMFVFHYFIHTVKIFSLPRMPSNFQFSLQI
jgi:hypothetical protein